MIAWKVGLTAAITALALTKPTIVLARRLGLVTDKKTRFHPAHTHVGIIPRAGGLPIWLGFLVSVLIFIPLNKIVVGIIICTTLLVILGLLDDYLDLSPYWRFAANIVIAILMIMFGLGIPYISNPFGGVIRLDTLQIHFSLLGGNHSLWVVADLLAIIWLAWTMNMVNWSKGVDGQLPGFVAIAAFFLGLLAKRFTVHDITSQEVMFLSFATAGAFLGFLPWNFFPQKIMPGYGGGSLAGFLLGVLAILSFGKIGTLFLVLAIPTIDAVYTVIRRLVKKQSPFRADWGHFHHRLLEIGWGKRRIAIFYWLITFIFGVTSLFLKGLEKLIALVTTAIILFSFIFIIEKIKRQLP
ncbi:undecaprenyl/decaprenyl-phosphate alpha-N-acetylglucosaminyl 1-phosphate transferase [Patescibacteria group bacterium]|nr:undecaprenyl/decaprenyl-phosphate alpha-N-acetylglucosaminyl 1-phosphate transferase [Patescibacteria group bacterium]MCL5091659.1 undecaprenyl/decaprenyl-phosphate alpha-N-acetylglucosaminyl 1-phosphate transferase [Patescibacteria group bacterium]